MTLEVLLVRYRGTGPGVRTIHYRNPLLPLTLGHSRRILPIREEKRFRYQSEGVAFGTDTPSLNPSLEWVGSIEEG